MAAPPPRNWPPPPAYSAPATPLATATSNARASDATSALYGYSGPQELRQGPPAAFQQRQELFVDAARQQYEQLRQQRPVHGGQSALLSPVSANADAMRIPQQHMQNHQFQQPPTRMQFQQAQQLVLALDQQPQQQLAQGKQQLQHQQSQLHQQQRQLQQQHQRQVQIQQPQLAQMKQQQHVHHQFPPTQQQQPQPQVQKQQQHQQQQQRHQQHKQPQKKQQQQVQRRQQSQQKQKHDASRLTVGLDKQQQPQQIQQQQPQMQQFQRQQQQRPPVSAGVYTTNQQQTQVYQPLQQPRQQQTQHYQQQQPRQHQQQQPQRHQQQPQRSYPFSSGITGGNSSSDSSSSSTPQRSGSAVIQPGIAIVPPQYPRDQIPMEMPAIPRLGPPSFKLPFVRDHNGGFSGFSYGGGGQMMSNLRRPVPRTIASAPVTFVPCGAATDGWPPALPDKLVDYANSHSSSISTSEHQFAKLTWNREHHYSPAASAISSSFSDATGRGHQATVSVSNILNPMHQIKSLQPVEDNQPQQLQQYQALSSDPEMAAAKALFQFQSPVNSPRVNDVGINVCSVTANSNQWLQPQNRGPPTLEKSITPKPTSTHVVTPSSRVTVSQVPSAAAKASESVVSLNKPPVKKRPLVKRKRVIDTATTTTSDLERLVPMPLMLSMPAIDVVGSLGDGWVVPESLTKKKKWPKSRVKPAQQQRANAAPSKKILPKATTAAAFEGGGVAAPTQPVKKRAKPNKRAKEQQNATLAATVLATPPASIRPPLPDYRVAALYVPAPVAAVRIPERQVPASDSAAAMVVSHAIRNLMNPVTDASDGGATGATTQQLLDQGPKIQAPAVQSVVDLVTVGNTTKVPVPGNTSLKASASPWFVPTGTETETVSAQQESTGDGLLEQLEAEASAPPMSSQPNNTIMIFCKRDFMRYQALKLWKKYQEKKKKMEFQSVQVLGKRTRYVNAKYEEEKLAKEQKQKANAPKKTKKSKAVEPAQLLIVPMLEQADEIFESIEGSTELARSSDSSAEPAQGSDGTHFSEVHAVTPAAETALAATIPEADEAPSSALNFSDSVVPASESLPVEPSVICETEVSSAELMEQAAIVAPVVAPAPAIPVQAKEAVTVAQAEKFPPLAPEAAIVAPAPDARPPPPTEEVGAVAPAEKSPLAPEASVVAPVVAPVVASAPAASPPLTKEAAIVASDKKSPSLSLLTPEAPAVAPATPLVPKAPILAPALAATPPPTEGASIVAAPAEMSPSLAPETPVVAPEAPIVAPEAPIVAPEAPVVAPEAPVVAPEAPIVAPEAPVVAPTPASSPPPTEDVLIVTSTEKSPTLTPEAAFVAPVVAPAPAATPPPSEEAVLVAPTERSPPLASEALIVAPVVVPASLTEEIRIVAPEAPVVRQAAATASSAGVTSRHARIVILSPDASIVVTPSGQVSSAILSARSLPKADERSPTTAAKRTAAGASRDPFIWISASSTGFSTAPADELAIDPVVLPPSRTLTEQDQR